MAGWLSNYQDLKIGDLGLAKLCRDVDQDGNITNYEQYMTTFAGTCNNMAPEVFGRKYKKNSDVYSMGLVFLQMAASPALKRITIKKQGDHDEG